MSHLGKLDDRVDNLEEGDTVGIIQPVRREMQTLKRGREETSDDVDKPARKAKRKITTPRRKKARSG